MLNVQTEDLGNNVPITTVKLQKLEEHLNCNLMRRWPFFPL